MVRERIGKHEPRHYDYLVDAAWAGPEGQKFYTSDFRTRVDSFRIYSSVQAALNDGIAVKDETNSGNVFIAPGCYEEPDGR